jgi:hypothetical protein
MASSKSSSKKPIVSYGIACFNHNSEVCFVKRRISYAFSDFCDNIMRGITAYNLLTDMTFSELLDIQCGDPKIIYNRFMPAESNNPQKQSLFAYKFNHIYTMEKLKNAFISGGISFIDDIIELPKGRRIRNESPLDAAIREFEEETKIPHNAYTVEPSIKTSITFIDNGVEYMYIIFLATLIDDQFCDTRSLRQQILFDYTKMRGGEISDVMWITRDSVKSLSERNERIPCLRQTAEVINNLFEAHKELCAKIRRSEKIQRRQYGNVVENIAHIDHNINHAPITKSSAAICSNSNHIAAETHAKHFYRRRQLSEYAASPTSDAHNYHAHAHKCDRYYADQSTRL